MKRVVALALLCVLAACGRGTQVTVLSQDDLPAELYGESVVPKTEERTVRSTLYFVRTDAERNLVEPARLERVEYEERTSLTDIQLVAQRVLRNPRELLPGPEGERLGTAIPSGTQLLSVSVKDGLADVNLSAQFENAAPDLLQLLRVAQVVYTLTELPKVNAVRFRIHGAPQPVVDPDGVAHERVGRGRYSRFAPTDPSGGEVGDTQVGAD